MRIQKAVAVLLLFPAALLLHAKNKKPAGVPAIFAQARYVFVEAIDGKEFDPNLNPDDRIAIADVRNGLGNWKRYVLTADRSDADVVVVVRKGRAESGNIGITPRRGQMPNGTGMPGTPGPGAQIGGDVGPPEDLFEVCTVNPDGKLSAPLWERTMPDGLRAPQVMLLEQFEEAVDTAYPPQPAAAKGQTTTQQQPSRQQQPQAQKP